MKLFFLLLMAAFGVEAEVPTITLTNKGASVLTSPTFYAATNSFFAYGFTPHIYTNDANDNFTNAAFALHPYGGLQMPLDVMFSVNAQQFEVSVGAAAPGTIQVWDGTNLSAVNYYINSNTVHASTWLVLVSYTTKTLRNVKVSISGSSDMWFGGLNIASGDTVATNTFVTQRTLEVLGDSYTEGYSQQDLMSRFLGGFASDLDYQGTNLLTIPSGVGGTGYYWPGSGSNEEGQVKTNYLARVWTDVISNQPTFLIIESGLNDEGNSVGTNNMAMNATNVFGICKANLISTNIIVVGPFTVNSTPSASDYQYDEAISNAAAAWNLPYISPIKNTWLNAGNASIMFGAGTDNVHPSIAGYLIYATNITAFANLYWPTWTNSAAPPAVVYTYLPFRTK